MDFIPYEAVAGAVIVILALCGAIVMVANTVKALKEWRKPRNDEMQMVMKHDEKLINDYNDIAELKKEVRIILECLRPVLQHLIDGNDVESLKQQQEFLDRYLINLVEK